MPLTDKDLVEMDVYQAIDLLPSDHDQNDRGRMIRRWQVAQVNIRGYTGEYVNDDHYPYGLNAHTHGLKEKFHHLDLQLVLNIHPSTIAGIFENCAVQIREGVVFECGQDYDGILGNFNIRFMEVIEQDRRVLRIILPDSNGNLDSSTIANNLKDQYQIVE